ncbi:MAG: serine/threonine protein kinase [Gemmatimonadetes bacterium]|nr:serine/threonine protein kinase [Gemmatimonadota bacterium]
MTEVSSADQERFDRLRDQLTPDLELTRMIGEGSVARVYLAREPALKRMVAVKVLREEIAADDVARLRFEREGQAAASLSHPNNIRVHRVGRLPDGVPYMVVEHVDGRTLAARLETGGPLRVEEVRRVLASVAAVLAAAHRKGIVHRDVRPANILRETQTRRVVLFDFGLAALLETGQQTVMRLTATGERVGDLEHLSPEQLRDEPLTPQSDVYALGVLAYELLTGAGPFPASSAAELVHAQLTSEPRPLAEVRPDVDAGLATLVRRCLAKDPGRRPDAHEVYETLVRGPGHGAPAADTVLASADDGGLLSSIPGLRDFFAELKRRKVARVAAAYVAGAFIFLQGMELIMPALRLQDPDTLYGVIATVTLAGFPAALVLSWIFDFTAAGIRRSAAPAREVTSEQARWRLLLPIVGLTLSVGVAVAAWLLLM